MRRAALLKRAPKAAARRGKSAPVKRNGAAAHKPAQGRPKRAAPEPAPHRNDERTRKLRAIRAAAARAADESDPGDSHGDASKRSYGMRGSAPWVARHAVRQAEEMRRRNAEPPPPGSARATLRTPKEAEQIKNRVKELHQRTSHINALRKRLDKSFFDIGVLLNEIQASQLHEAKGYANFEAFIDREIEIPRVTALKLMRIVHIFEREAALDFPVDRLIAAIAALDGELMAVPPSQAAASNRSLSSAALPPKPPIRYD